jgi:hypothetical protein
MSRINIIEPTLDYDSSNLNISSPIQTPGNNLISKIVLDNQPLYVYAPKSSIKINKKYCDLFYSHDDIIFIQWLENIESSIKKLLLVRSRREKWFHNLLDEEDIDDYFQSVVKIYKTGKYSVRINNIKADKKIFNTDDVIISLSEVKENTLLNSILEIKGIKLSKESFQLEIEFMQGQIEEDNLFVESYFKKKRDVFSKRIIKKEKEEEPVEKFEEVIEPPPPAEHLLLEFKEELSENKEEEVKENEGIVEENKEENEEIVEEEKDNIEENKENIEEIKEENEEENKEIVEEVKENVEERGVKFEEGSFGVLGDVVFDDLESVDFNKDDYEDVYKEAKEEAIRAKEEAIQAYLKSKETKERAMDLFVRLNELKNKYGIEDEISEEIELN